MLKCRLLGCLHFFGGMTLNTAAEPCGSQLCRALNSSPAMIPLKEFSHPFCFAPIVQFPFCTISLCKALFSLWSCCFAAGARAVVLSAGIPALPSSPLNFFLQHLFWQNEPLFLLAPLSPPSPYTLQQTVCQGLIFRLFVYSADEARFVKRNNSLYWNN